VPPAVPSGRISVIDSRVRGRPIAGPGAGPIGGICGIGIGDDASSMRKPQVPQNRNDGGTSLPHDGQRRMLGAAGGEKPGENPGTPGGGPIGCCIAGGIAGPPGPIPGPPSGPAGGMPGIALALLRGIA